MNEKAKGKLKAIPTHRFIYFYNWNPTNYQQLSESSPCMDNCAVNF